MVGKSSMLCAGIGLLAFESEGLQNELPQGHIKPLLSRFARAALNVYGSAQASATRMQE
jgi:hypothetical protein